MIAVTIIIIVFGWVCMGIGYKIAEKNLKSLIGGYEVHTKNLEDYIAYLREKYEIRV
jgi:hypothetical protein